MSLSFPPKFVDETPVLEFDFISKLPVGVSLSSATVAVSVISGEDLNPSALVGSPTVSGTVASIPTAAAGVPGVIYDLKVKATASDTKIYELHGTLAVL